MLDKIYNYLKDSQYFYYAFKAQKAWNWHLFRNRKLVSDWQI